MHYYGRFDDAALRSAPLFEGHATGYRQADLVTRATGSMHTGLSVAELAPGGVLESHLHAFEESFYVLAGEAVVSIDGAAFRLGPGDYGAVKVGTPHAWRAAGKSPVFRLTPTRSPATCNSAPARWFSARCTSPIGRRRRGILS